VTRPSYPPFDVDEYIESNRALWDAWTPIHERSDMYDLEGFKRGGVRIRDFEREDVGDVAGKTLLHLQCHFGIDTLSWARLGATVTGADFSERAIELARKIAAEIGVDDARFVQANLYDLPSILEGEFDIVYTGRGAISWLPDIRRWAGVAAHFVKPGRIFYMNEFHPIAQVLDDESDEVRLRYPYFEHVEPLAFDVRGSYADPAAHVEHDKEYGWSHGLGEVVSALVDAGLRIDLLREFPWVDFKMLPVLEQREDGNWWLPRGLEGELPLMFTLRATRPPSRSE
jgi:ubiquinone/menaquinone biosynthesis C-methylase UbiE